MDVRVGFGLHRTPSRQGFKLQASRDHGLGPRMLPYGRSSQVLVAASAVNLGFCSIGILKADPAFLVIGNRIRHDCARFAHLPCPLDVTSAKVCSFSTHAAGLITHGHSDQYSMWIGVLVLRLP